jgi:hypothetical protein
MKIVYSRRMRISLPDHKVNSTGRERKKEQKGEGEKERKGLINHKNIMLQFLNVA